MTIGTGGDAVVETLRAAGVDTLFGIPGGHNIDLFDAVVRDGSIRAVLPRHEQGAGFMADGYARVGARTGVIACLEGPGMGNAMTALGEALQDSSPVLVVSSQIRSDLHDGGFGVIHELPNHLETFRAATRYSARAGVSRSGGDRGCPRPRTAGGGVQARRTSKYLRMFLPTVGSWTPTLGRPGSESPR